MIKCLGAFWAEITYKNKQVKEQIYLIDSDTTENLLGRKTITALNLINRIDNLDSSIFGDITNVPLKCKPVKIKLKENSEPYSLSTPRRIPIPIMRKVEMELKRMKTLGVIEEISEPTDWCSPMVPVIKKDGSNSFKSIKALIFFASCFSITSS